MPSYFCLTIRFLQPFSHSRRNNGEPEWPPSPLRAFQALAAAAAARWNERMRLENAAPALRWLEAQQAPTIAAAVTVPSGAKYRLYVPDNVTDKVARSWRGGNANASIADYRTEKDVCPTRLSGDDAVHYLYSLPAEGCPYLEVLSAAARSITHLGWGVDMVAGNAGVITDAEAANLSGERWHPALSSPDDGLRVPTGGTLSNLVVRHTAFLSRLSDEAFRPVPPLSAFCVVGYRRATDPVDRPFVAFELRTPDFERFRPFDATRHTAAVAGMVRSALAALARDMRPFGWTDENINTFIHGHSADGGNRARGPGADQRFSYLPLPSLERRGESGVVVGSVRRVLVVGPRGADRQVAWARVLSGQELSRLDERMPPAALRLIDRSAGVLRNDPNLKWYVGESRVWSTVTPVLRPGHDDGDSDKAMRLWRTTFLQAGWTKELVESAEVEWRRVGFRAGVDLADRYAVPEPLARFRRYHVRLRFPVPVRGPLAVGAGRYRGIGVLAAEE
jgi:CRISPR-associated protein Csb2